MFPNLLRQGYAITSLNKLYSRPTFRLIAVNPSRAFADSRNLSEPSGHVKKPRRWFRRLFLVTLLSTVSVAGLLYTSSYFRNLVTQGYPSVKPFLDKAETFVGGWYDENGSKVHLDSSAEFPLPNLRERFSKKHPENEPHFDPTLTNKHQSENSKTTVLPTLEDVVEMTEERSKTVFTTKTAPIAQCISDAQRAVKTATLTIGDLETATRNHIEGLREAIKSAESSSNKDKKWDHVSKMATLKDKAETKANTAVNQAKEALDVLKNSIHHYKLGEDSSESESLPDGISAYGKLQYALSGSIYEVRKLQNELSMLMRYRDLASKTHEALQTNLASIHQDTDLDKSIKAGSFLNADELKSLIEQAHNRIGELKVMLTEAEEKEKSRLNSALEAQRRADEELIADYVKRELELERSKHELDRYRWAQESREATDRELRQDLARQSEHLAHMLRLKEEEKEHEFAHRIREKLAQEKTAFEAALSGWIQRMRAIEDVVDGRAELDRLAKETQALWIACEALACSLSSAVPTVSDKISHSTTPNTTGPLTDFTEAIREVASTEGRHPFVLSVLDELPPEALSNGVWLERSLKERFEKVYRVCRRVALVDETGGSLYTYALSWLQSVLMFDYVPHQYLSSIPWIKSDTFVPILKPDSELDSDEPDTFLLLRSAKAALTIPSTEEPDAADGDLEDGIEIAVRLLSQLRGQARLVAADWLEDARRYLESKQAAQALLAYSTARGMSAFQKRL